MEGDHLEAPGVDGRIILKWILNTDCIIEFLVFAHTFIYFFSIYNITQHVSELMRRLPECLIDDNY